MNKPLERKVTEEFTVRLAKDDGKAIIRDSDGFEIEARYPAINAAIAEMRHELRPCVDGEAMYRGRRVRFEVDGSEIHCRHENGNRALTFHVVQSRHSKLVDPDHIALRAAAFAWYERTREVGLK